MGFRSCLITYPLTSRSQYALTAMQNLMELDYGWANLDNSFIFRVVQILASEQSPINVCRPATAILKKLVEADPSSVLGTHTAASTSKGPPTPPPGSVYRYGFDVVFEQMRKERRLLETVVLRLGSADTTMALYRFVLYIYTTWSHVLTLRSMMLINSLMAHASDPRWDEFIAELERLNVRKAVIVRYTPTTCLICSVHNVTAASHVITHD